MSYDFDNSGTTRLSVATPIAALPLTIAAWFKVESDGSGNAIVCLGNASNSEIFRLAAAMDVASDPIRFRAASTGGSNHDFGGGSISLNTWYHAAIVVSGTGQAQRAVFLNGTKYTSAGANTRDITSATILSIGAQYQAGTYGVDIDGKIAHVAVWDVALTDGNITSLAGGANPLTISASDLVSYWPLTADLVDLIASLTLTNSGGASLSGDNPTVDPVPGGVSETPATATIEITGYAPVVGVGGAVSLTPATAEIEITGYAPTVDVPVLTLLPDDTDAVSYNVSTSNVTGDTLNLAGFYDSLGFDGWVNTNAVLSNAANRSISLVLDSSGKQTAGPPPGNNNTTGTPWTPIWRSEAGGVIGVWQKVSGYSRSTNTIYGTVATGASDTDVRVAYKLVLTVGELDAFRQELYASPNVAEPVSSVTASSLPQGVHARLSHGTGANTVAAGTVDLWCAKIGSGPLNGLIVLCEHAQEDVGDYSALQFLRWVTGASAEAAAFRARFTVHVYVHNLSGRKTGRTRYNADVGTDEDANREWDSSASEQTNALKAAINTYDIPTGQPLAFLLAYHGQQDANVTSAAFDIYTTTSSSADQEFYTRVRAIVGSQVSQQDTASPTSGTSKWFGRVSRSAPLSLTLEHADAAAGYPDPAAMYDTFAAATGTTLSALADEGYLGSQTLTPAAGAIEITGYAPSVQTTGAVAETPEPAQIEITGYAPITSTGGGVSLNPASNDIEITGYPPTVVAGGNVYLFPTPGAIRITGYAPTLSGVGGWQIQAPVTTIWAVQ